MNYKQTLDFLYQAVPMYHLMGSAAYDGKLTKTKQFLSALGHPEKNTCFIHVAGTNGKGSVTHNLASIFQESGYKTGLYTSPHLKDFRERICINGKKIPQSKVVQFVEQNRSLIEEIQPSFFEMTVAMAFEYFAEQKVDIAIIEVGLGGRMDATNVIQPLLSVITNISFDHMQFLGNTLPSIAKEKAGIIKKDTPVIIGKIQEETQDVFVKIAQQRHAPCLFAENIFQVKAYKTTLHQHQLWTHYAAYRIQDGHKKTAYKQLISPLGGLCQEENLATVLACADWAEKNKLISHAAIKKGIKNCIENTHLMGRWQLLGTKPFIIADTGHNQAGIELISRQLASMKYQQLHIVLGVVNDKDLQHILPLLPQKATYYFCKADIPRGLDAHILQSEAAKYHLKGEVYTSIAQALKTAKQHASKKDLIFVGGSTFTVAEVI